MFFDQVETEGPASPLLIDVRHSTHQWAKDHLSVVLEKVDLEKVSRNDRRKKFGPQLWVYLPW